MFADRLPLQDPGTLNNMNNHLSMDGNGDCQPFFHGREIRNQNFNWNNPLQMDFSGSRYKKELHLEFIFISQLFHIVRWPISRVQPNLQSSGPLWCLLHSNFAHFAICTLKKSQIFKPMWQKRPSWGEFKWPKKSRFGASASCAASLWLNDLTWHQIESWKCHEIKKTVYLFRGLLIWGLYSLVI